MAFCSCIPPPASLQPRKIYNVLVPDVFPPQPPPVTEPVPNSIRRKIAKLHEYVQRSPGKIAKVSRRLNRRLKQALYEKQLGYVRIAVTTYIYLLKQSTAEDSRYSHSYFSKELISQPDAVIDTLLNHPLPAVQGLGAELLAAYIEAQSEVENQPAVVEQLTRSVVRLLLGKSRTGPAAHGTAAAAAAAAVGPPKLPQETSAACMMALKEYVTFCQKVKKLPGLLAEVQECILSNVDLSSAEVQQAMKAYGDATPAAGAAKNPNPKPASSSDVALSAMRSLRPYMQDIGVVYRLLDTQLGYLDRGGRWEQPAQVQGLLGLAEAACGEQRYPLFTSLLRHASAPGLPPNQRAIIIRQALQRAGPYSLSAISLALAELPKALVTSEEGAAGAGGAQEVRAAATEAVQKLAQQVGDLAQLSEALAGALRQHRASPSSSSSSSSLDPLLKHALELGLEAVKASRALNGPGKGFPPKASPASLLTQLCAVVWDATERSSGAEQPAAQQARTAAVHIAEQLLDAPGFAVTDERPALALVAGAAALASDSAPQARELALASAFTGAAAAGGRQAVLSQVACFATGLRSMLLKSNGDVQRTCQGLLLVECILQQLASAAQCPGLAQLATPGDALRKGAAGLALVIPAAQAATGAGAGSGRVVALATLRMHDSGAGGGVSASTAAAGVKAAAEAADGLEHWAAAFAAALGAGGAVSGEAIVGGSLGFATQLAAASATSTPDQLRSVFAPLLLSQLPRPVAAVGTTAAAGAKGAVSAAAPSPMDQAQLLSQRVEQSWKAGREDEGSFVGGPSAQPAGSARGVGPGALAGAAGVHGSSGRGATPVNLEKVLEMIEADKAAGGLGAGSGAGAARTLTTSASLAAAEAAAAAESALKAERAEATRNGASGSAALSIEQALMLVSSLAPGAPGGPSGVGKGHKQTGVDVGALADQLELVVM